MFDWITHNKGLFLNSYTEIGASHPHAMELQTQHNHFAMNCMVRIFEPCNNIWSSTGISFLTLQKSIRSSRYRYWGRKQRMKSALNKQEKRKWGGWEEETANNVVCLSHTRVFWIQRLLLPNTVGVILLCSSTCTTFSWGSSKKVAWWKCCSWSVFAL